MKLRLLLAAVAAFAVVAVLFRPVLYIAIGALVVALVAVLWVVCSGLTREGERRALFAEAWRQVQGIELRRRLIRREGAHLAAVEEAKDEFRAER